MERGQRIALLLAAVIVAVVAFIALRPTEETDEPAVPSAADGETTPPAATDAATAPPEEPASTPEARPAPPRAEIIRISGGKVTGGQRSIEVEKGEDVHFVVTSDDARDEVHLHGYDIRRDVAPGSPARFKFRAKVEGVFEVELEGSHTQIAMLRVEP